ncbi:unnamed protein product [Blepharisma stoltei]|uniref:Uncharacterized protein n=1 Tax=Blepharisma stoltei TaxID=1481888 RepID=A0AAU9J8N6_9CILI|nr:unnamed protein product [Blepharisma stoltei]
MISKDVYRSPPREVSSYILNNYKKFDSATSQVPAKNQEYATIHQYPNSPSAPSNYVQGVKPLDPIELRNKEKAYFEYVKKQNEIINKVRDENRLREAYEIEQKIQRFQEDRMNEINQKKKLTEDLANSYANDVNYKSHVKEAEKKEKRIRDEEILMLAKLAMDREQQLKNELREQQNNIAKENLTNAGYRKDLVDTSNQAWKNDVVNLQEKYAKEVEDKERAYREKYSKIEKRQAARQQIFQQKYLEPMNQKFQQIDEAISSRFQESQILARQKEILDVMRAKEEKEKFISAISQQVQAKEDLEIEKARQETEALKKRLAELEEMKQERMVGLQDKKIKEKNRKYDLKGDQLEFDINVKKFFGIEDEENELDKAAAVFYGVDVKRNEPELSPVVNAKTNIKSVSHDPITGSLRNYKVERKKLYPLGNPKPEEVSDKINDVQLDATYEFPQFGKKVPRNKISNPLTGEVIEIDRSELNSKAFAIVTDRKLRGSLSQPDLTSNASTGDIFKIGKSELPRNFPASPQRPIYKGMGYKKSSIFE